MNFGFDNGRWRTLVIACASCAIASGQAISQHALQQISELTAEKAARTPVQQKIDSRLHYAGMSVRGARLTASVPGFPSALNALQHDATGNVLVDIKANVTPQVLNSIQALGGTVVSVSTRYQSIRAMLPLLRTEDLAGLTYVNLIRPADLGHGNALTSTASIHQTALRTRLEQSLAIRKALPFRKLGASFFMRPVSQGFVAHGANLVLENYGIDGTGVKVGVLSDGVDALASLQATGDLPGVNVIPGQAGSGNEGSAMLEIVYDLAPGAQLYFATAAAGEAQMAANILALREAGCDIILDDWTYFDESVFQDGIISQAVNTVTAQGALYFSDAQNSGNLDSASSGTWEGDFSDSGTTIPGLPGGVSVHSFGSADADLITGTSGFGIIYLKWSDPLGASSNDYDFYMLNNTLTQVLEASTNVQNGTQDPEEAFGCSSCAGNQLVIVKNASAQIRGLHVDTERGRLQVGTAGATFGHNAAGSAITVAAVNVADAHGGLFTGGVADPVEFYSSDGPRRIFYLPDGTPITAGNFLFATNGGTVLQKDDIAAADCASGDAPGFTIFCGTSAATPHAGAIAALIKSGFPDLTSYQVVQVMKGTALDIMAPGVDRDSGAGLVMANTAVAALSQNPALQVLVGGATLSGSSKMIVTLNVTNRAPGEALSVTLNSLTFKTLNGSGVVSSASSLPIQIGSIPPYQSITFTVLLNVPATVIRYSIASGFSYQNGAGAILQSAAGNVVVR